MKQRFMPLLAAMALFTACTKTDVTPPATVAQDNLLAPQGFVFATDRSVQLNLQLLSNDDAPLPGVRVQVYSKTQPDRAVFTGLTDGSGRLLTRLLVPAYADSLIIDPAYVGVMRQAVAAIRNNSVTATLGGKAGFSGDIVPDALTGRFTGQANYHRVAGTVNNTTISFLGSYDNTGRPHNLATPDVISAELLSFVNSSLPEGKSVKKHHPAYLSANAETRLHIKKTSDVWVTLVHEGTEHLNALGFYSYPVNRQPKDLSEIAEIKIAIPNTSFVGKGGSMKSGDKVLLGRFEAGTMVDLVLLQNAWQGSRNTIDVTATKYFADDRLNNEKPSDKRHAALLHDTKNKIFLYGFEDKQRDNGKSDHDFNDLVFYTTTNPVESISDAEVSRIDTPVDSDGDGVIDLNDEYPTDAAKAYTQFFPAENAWGTVAFEDTWPHTGDYDLNDLVVRYQYAYTMNAEGKVVGLKGTYVAKAVGAGQKNSFGIQFPFAAAKVRSVTGQRLTSSFITLAANGTEAGQTKAVVFPFDDPKSLFGSTGTGMVNVYTSMSSLTSDTVNVDIALTAPLTMTELGTAPFNPFLVPNQQRTYEIHLPGQQPTDKANTRLFGTGKDDSKPAQNRYYLSANNWPWALSFVEEFDYPVEGIQISKGYPKFLTWAKSAGTTDLDWYRPGNRIGNYIYNK